MDIVELWKYYRKFREKYIMNILVIRNGFDLAHGLTTKHGDFLEFCGRIKNFILFIFKI